MRDKLNQRHKIMNTENVSNKEKGNVVLADVSKSFTYDLEPKITFINELWVGKVKVPVRTELDFSGVHPLQHEKILKIAHKIYCVDKQVKGC
jgi:hypothetical protein